MKKIICLFVFLCFIFHVHPQETFPSNGIKKNYKPYYAFTNATLHITHQKVVENGILLIRDNKIEEAGNNIKIPKGAVVIDVKGKHIYPSFIDLYSNYGMPAITAKPWNPMPQYETTKKGAFAWNETIHPETRAAELFKCDSKTANEYRMQGFGTVLTHQQDGLMRGTSSLVALGDQNENEQMLITDAAMQLSLRKGISQQAYPSSLMGCIALLRQTYYDAKWYKTQKNIETNISLQALNNNWNLPQIIEANDKYNVLRADKIGDEFGIQYIIKSSGNEYQRIKEIKSTGAKLILPLNFPDAYDVENVYDAQNVSFTDMKHWEMAPANLFLLYKYGIDFAITCSDLKDRKNFIQNLRKAVKYGLPETEALKALTILPAQLIGADKMLATLEKGKLANFIICSDNFFKHKTVIHENWINGKKYTVTEFENSDLRGEYNLNVNNIIYPLSVKGELEKPKATVKSDTANIETTLTFDYPHITLSFILNDKNYTGAIRLTGVVNGDGGLWDGNAQLPDGRWIKWSCIRNKKFIETEKKEEKDSIYFSNIIYPFQAYGFDSLPKAIPVLIKNATVWTNENEGILKNTDILIQDGKIKLIGKILDVVDKNTWVIDATGKHVTAGIIDEHSHIAINGGVNEGGQSVSAEVSIADVINADDINIYRQLAGGVIAAQLLHGSANPIGGQSAIIKFRWGKSPEEMKIIGADGFIKCALGENVKQSNWGDFNTIRYPQTRMGVEQVFYDAFHRALQYEKDWEEYYKLSKKDKNISPPRKDIECDILLEIVRGKRFISCHSYVQSEINMLMKVADSMGFKINTFTHILEGYKVADKMAKHGVAGSTFSDWWAYKMEVQEAIPYNAALMHKQGVLVGINSDDAEMARRLPKEAAKAVKYGNVSEEEALKMVTLNPAKMLHLDKQTGSIKNGKDADIVIWNTHPLSVYAKAEKTFVDGICYFDIDRDKILRDKLQEERMRLIKKMIEAKKKGEPTQKVTLSKKRLFHCNSEGDEFIVTDEDEINHH